jgi:hypothetical protein
MEKEKWKKRNGKRIVGQSDFHRVIRNGHVKTCPTLNDAPILNVPRLLGG